MSGQSSITMKNGFTYDEDLDESIVRNLLNARFENGNQSYSLDHGRHRE